MKFKIIMILSLIISSPTPCRADLFGNDLPLLFQIVVNTLQTLHELKKQSDYMDESIRGIKDKIYRIESISKLIEPSSWDQWRDPEEALRRIRQIYHTLPSEYRSEKADFLENEISKAMNLISQLKPEASRAFISGKQLEQMGKDSSPGVAQKLTASGVGTLIALQSQSQVLQSQMTSLLSQILADANEKETRTIIQKGSAFSGISKSLGEEKGWFSNHVTAFRW